ncbi:MAG: ISL3 family transposase [Verrucomicrobiaceae bacterium]|nr:MAG: ISL3 family transposase [Verrucomicrobiaceae bacterium]
MDAKDLFTLALQLSPEWKVTDCLLDQENRRLTLKLDFIPGSKFPAPGATHHLLCAVHDTVEKRWRHLDFFQYETELVARVPRVKTPEGKVVQVEVPWARPGSGFTLLFEAWAMLLCGEMPVQEAGRMLREQDTRLWRILQHYVEEAQTKQSWSKVRRILVDETSARRGHRYVSSVVDAEMRQLLFVAEGRGSEVLGQFVQELRAHGGEPGQIELVAMDMSPSYIKGAREHLPKARVVFDHFHVMQMAGKALDEVRKELRREGADLRDGLWALRGNEWTRSKEQLERRRELCRTYPKLGRAMMLRELLQDILAQEDPELLRWWCTRAKRSRLGPFKKLADSLREHWDGVVAFMETRVTNGVIEAINGLLQLAKRMARGFRSFATFRTIALLKVGKLKLDLPQLLPT